MKHTGVSAYIRSLVEEWQREVCDELRRLIHEAAPKVTESMQKGEPFFDCKGPLCTFTAAEETVSLVFAHGAQLPPSPLFTGHTGPARTISIKEGQMVPAQEVIGLVHEAVKLNTAG